MGVVQVMISSRSESEIKIGESKVKLRDLRRELKQRLQDDLPVKVWIFEDDPESKGTGSALVECIQKARTSDIVLVLYNGEAGYSGKGGIGICHQEYMEAMNQCPGKVCVVNLDSNKNLKSEIDKAFRVDIERNGKLFARPSSKDDFFEKAKEQVEAAIVKLVRLGRGSLGTRNRSLGQALDWTRYPFDQRRNEIIKSIKSQIQQHSQCKYRNNDYFLSIKEDSSSINQRIRLIISAIPAGLNIAEAAGPLGKPYCYDFKVKFKKNEVGPIHLIGVFGNVTEGQVRKFLGIDDGMFVSIENTGIFAVDTIQNSQVVFLANCINETTSGTRVQNFLNWLSESGEANLVLQRADARAAIAKKIGECNLTTLRRNRRSRE